MTTYSREIQGLHMRLILRTAAAFTGCERARSLLQAMYSCSLLSIAFAVLPAPCGEDLEPVPRIAARRFGSQLRRSVFRLRRQWFWPIDFLFASARASE